MRIGILGCGSIGQRHARNLRALGVTEIVAFDPSPERQAEIRAIGAQTVEDRDALLARRPDAVFVCTPPALHLDDIRAAIAAAAHLFVEKPIASDLDGLGSTLEAAGRAGLHLRVGYNLRHDRGLRAAKDVADAGGIGRIISIVAEFGQYLPDWRPGRDYRAGYNARLAMGGGVVLDQSHEIDYVRWFAGEVIAVSAVAKRLGDLESDTEDVAILTLEHAGGALASIYLDSLRRDYRRACTIIGTEATLAWDLDTGTRRSIAGRGWEQLVAATDRNEMYVAEVREFIGAIERGDAPEVDITGARRVLEIALAAKRSAAEGRRIAL